MSWSVRAGLVLGWLLRVEHRLSVVPGVGDGGALLGPEGAGQGLRILGRELREKGPSGFLRLTGMTVLTSKCLAGGRQRSAVG
jgi:hypothetical protein